MKKLLCALSFAVSVALAAAAVAQTVPAGYPADYAKVIEVSCPRIFWTPICPTGGIHDEVEHDPNRNHRCE